MKEALARMIDEAKEAYRQYCLALVTGPVDEDVPRISEAAFIADKLIEGGVCIRLEIPEDAAPVARRCATCLYEAALGSDRCVRCVGHELWEGRTDGKRNR